MSRSRNPLSMWAAPQHKCAAKMLGMTLTIGKSSAWQGFALWLAAKLSDKERISLAWSALMSLKPEHREKIAEEFSPHIGMPDTPYSGVMAQADHWASWASKDELKCYAVASYQRLSIEEQAAFLRFIGCEVAA